MQGTEHFCVAHVCLRRLQGSQHGCDNDCDQRWHRKDGDMFLLTLLMQTGFRCTEAGSCTYLVNMPDVIRNWLGSVGQK